MKQIFSLIMSCSLSLAHAMEITPPEQYPQTEKSSTKSKAIFSHPEDHKDIWELIYKATHHNNCCYSVIQARNTLKSLICLNRSFELFFKDKPRLSRIIKETSYSFKCSHEKIVNILSFNKIIREIGRLQEHFFNYCKEDPECGSKKIELDLLRLKNDGVDFDFTYGNDKKTVLQYLLSATKFKFYQKNTLPACLRKWTDFGEKIIKYLISHDADLHIPAACSAYTLLFSYHPDLVVFLNNNNKLDPHKKDCNNRTPLELLNMPNRTKIPDNMIQEAIIIVSQAEAHKGVTTL